MERELTLEFVRVTEAAAIAAGRLVGSGDKNGADQLAVDAMRRMLNTLKIQGTVVIGEGEMDEAPMLYIGEKVGVGGTAVDIAVDPVEGTTLVAKGMGGAIAVLATAPAGHLLHAPDMYMDKIVAGPAGRGIVSLDASVEDNVRKLAQALGKPVKDVKVVVLDRERHQGIVDAVRNVGAKIHFLSDGDVSPAVAACLPNASVDLVLGQGGAPEGILAAAAVKALGGEIQGRLLPEDDAQLARMRDMGITDPGHILTIDQLVKGNDTLYVATGITQGDVLQGVQYGKDYCTTHTLVIRGATGTIRYVTAHHKLDKTF